MPCMLHHPAKRVRPRRASAPQLAMIIAHSGLGRNWRRLCMLTPTSRAALVTRDLMLAQEPLDKSASCQEADANNARKVGPSAGVLDNVTPAISPNLVIAE